MTTTNQTRPDAYILRTLPDGSVEVWDQTKDRRAMGGLHSGPDAQRRAQHHADQLNGKTGHHRLYPPDGSYTTAPTGPGWYSIFVNNNQVRDPDHRIYILTGPHQTSQEQDNAAAEYRRITGLDYRMVWQVHDDRVVSSPRRDGWETVNNLLTAAGFPGSSDH